MTYLYQNFSVGQLMDYASMNQFSANIRDHVHGTSQAFGTYAGSWISNEEDGLTVVANILDSENEFNQGKLFSLRNSGVSKLDVGTAGEIQNSLWIRKAASGGTVNTQSLVTVEDGTSIYLDLEVSKTGISGYRMSDNEAYNRGGFLYNHSDESAILGAGGTYLNRNYDVSTSFESKVFAVSSLNQYVNSSPLPVAFDQEIYDKRNEYTPFTSIFVSDRRGYFYSHVHLKATDDNIPSTWTVALRLNGQPYSYITAKGMEADFSDIIKIPTVHGTVYVEFSGTITGWYLEGTQCWWEIHKLSSL